jgi:hypothetical protein
VTTGEAHYADRVTRPLLNRRLDGLGNSIFGVMSARAVATASINLGQGFPDVDGPRDIAQAAADAILAGHGNQYRRRPASPSCGRRWQGTSSASTASTGIPSARC